MSHDPMDVCCPDCHAGAGHPCVGVGRKAGWPMVGLHNSRLIRARGQWDNAVSPPPTPDVERLTGLQMIAAERARQVSEEGWTPAHDDTHTDGSLARAAAVLACEEAEVPGYYGSWVEELAKKHYGNRLRELVIAGALIAAEIDRLLRVGDTPTPGGPNRE